jgi:hypothetical protein
VRKARRCCSPTRARRALPPGAPRALAGDRPSDAHLEAILALTNLAKLFRMGPPA